MALADTQAYFAAMQPLIVEGLGVVVDAAPQRVRSCGRWAGVEDGYYTQCPSPWLEITGNPRQTSNVAALVFPQAYFEWCKRYVGLALRNQPRAGASAEARVVWALDVWTHVQYGLWALNLPWANQGGPQGGVSRQVHLNGGPVPVYGDPGSVRNRFAAAINDFYKQAELAKKIEASIVTGEMVATGGQDVEGARQRAPLYPAPFMTVTPFWVEGGNNRKAQGSGATGPNPLWSILLRGVQPWSTSQLQLESKGGKDGGLLSDPVLSRARLQWRLWSVRDFFGSWGKGRSAMADREVWPYGMGAGDNCAMLEQYIAHVKTETSRSIAFSGAAYPTFRASFSAIASVLGRPFLSIDYAAEVRAQIDRWTQQTTSAADGSIIPVTYTDYRDVNKGMAELATARARIALQDPSILCEPGDNQCLEQAKRYKQVLSAGKKIPVYGQIVQGMLFLSDLLVQAVGGAVGWYNTPLRVIKPAFARTLSAQGYNMSPDGSTVDVVFRVLMGASNTWGHAEVQRPVSIVRDCEREVVQTPDGNYVTRCIGDTAGSVPDPAVVAARDTQCLQWWEGFQRDFPALAACAQDPTDQVAFHMVCRAMLDLKITPQQALNFWAQYLFQIKGCTLQPKRTPLTSFVDGMRATGHPFPSTGLRSGFLSSMNPLRLMRGRT